MNASAHRLKVVLRTKVELPYLLYLPKGRSASARRRVPLLLFLHGGGECGNDLEKVKTHGPPRLIEREGREFPFIVVAPQCPEGEDWRPESLLALMDAVCAAYPVDADRIYVTGLSHGGIGTWALAARYPDRFAAIAPICGPFLWLPFERLRKVPVWCFHGAMDGVVSVDDSIRMVRQLRGAGVDVRFTVYPDADHDSWTATYANPELYDWFLTHARKPHAARRTRHGGHDD